MEIHFSFLTTIANNSSTLIFFFDSFVEGMGFIDLWLRGAKGGISSEWMPDNITILPKKAIVKS